MEEKYRVRSNSNAEQKTEKQRNDENNANTIKNAAEVAIATKNPYAVAAGMAIKGLDKVTGGKSTEMLGKSMTNSFKMSPNGKQFQNLSNNLSESGMGDKIGQTASMVNGTNAKGGSLNADSSMLKSGSLKDSSLPNPQNTDLDEGMDSDLETNSSNKNSLFGGIGSNNGSFDAFKLIGKKKIIIGCGLVFFFIILMFTIVSAKDHSNLDITNKSEAMGSYVPGSMNVSTPTSISEIDNSTIGGNGGEILSKGNSLLDLLGEEGLRLLNESIESSASNAGYGTGAAPAAAAQALISNLLNNNIVLPYFWGGGHGSISSGADGSWGSYQYVGAEGHSTSFSNQPYGLDCSGFVSWALYNGGCKNFTPILAASFKDLGPGIDISQAKTGDIAASNSHVVLVLENRGDSLLVAEAKGTASGVIFSTRSSSNLANYKIVDMSQYYQTNCS